MSRLKSSLLLLMLISVGMAQQGATPLLNPEVRRIGEKLLCLCGCNSSVTSCNMINCGFADPVRVKLLKAVEAGTPEAQILAAFVEEHGVRVLRQPPAEGFNLVGWVMPFMAAGFGLIVVWVVIRRLSRPADAAPAPALSDAERRRYEAQIEKDLEKFDS